MLVIVVIACNLAFNWSLQSLKSLKNYFLCIGVLACEHICLSLLPVTGLGKFGDWDLCVFAKKIS